MTTDTQDLELRDGRKRLRSAVIDATPAVPPINITSNSAQDVEPSISTITASSVDRTFTTFIEYNPDPNVRYSSTTSFSSPFSNNAMPSTGYSYSGDPANAENFSTGGQGALRTYCAGIAFNGNETAPNAIVVWHSDPSDSGSFTASPTIVDSRYPTSITPTIRFEPPARPTMARHSAPTRSRRIRTSISEPLREAFARTLCRMRDTTRPPETST